MTDPTTALVAEIRSLRDRVDALNRRGDYPPHQMDTAWTAPTFTNSWANFSSVYPNAGYRVDSEGWVHLRGHIRTGTLGTSAFTLPTAYRPAIRHVVNTVASTNGAANIVIATTGTVTVNAQSNTFVSLSGVRFPLMDYADLRYRGVAVLPITTDVDSRPALLLRRSGMVELIGNAGPWTTADRAALAELAPRFGSTYRADGPTTTSFRIDLMNAGLEPQADVTTSAVLGGIEWPSPSIEDLFVTLTLQNAWVPYGVSARNWAAPSYFRDGDGIVHLRGMAKTGTASTTLATLPAGFRPGGRSAFLVASSNGDTRLDVNTDGTIVPLDNASATWTSLDGVQFLSEG